MSRFVGQKCQSCKESFEQDSVVVVCPECGAPYHEKCFLKEGKCVYEEQHGKEDCFSCEPAALLDVQICGHCGKQNSGADSTCDFCGRQLKTEIRIFKPQQKPPNSDNPGAACEEVPEEDDIDIFVGSNVSYYKRAFAKRYKFNFSAFACPLLYFFYRKMYREGCVFFISRMSVLLSTFLGLWGRWADCLQSLGQQERNSSMISGSGASNSHTILLLSHSITPEKWQEMGTSAINSFVFFFVVCIVMNLVMGFVANTTYKNYVQKKINILKSVPAAVKKSLLFACGGTNTSAAVLAAMCAIFCGLGVIFASMIHFAYF